MPSTQADMQLYSPQQGHLWGRYPDPPGLRHSSHFNSRRISTSDVMHMNRGGNSNAGTCTADKHDTSAKSQVSSHTIASPTRSTPVSFVSGWLSLIFGKPKSPQTPQPGTTAADANFYSHPSLSPGTFRAPLLQPDENELAVAMQTTSVLPRFLQPSLFQHLPPLNFLSESGNLAEAQIPARKVRDAEASPSTALPLSLVVVSLSVRERLLLYLDILAAAGESAGSLKENLWVGGLLNMSGFSSGGSKSLGLYGC